MAANWFATPLPPSRFVIEGELRSAFWRAGFRNMWVTCTREEPPYECVGSLGRRSFKMEWAPRNYLVLRSDEPEAELVKALEGALKHKALAAYRAQDGAVVVEWRAQNSEERLEELRASHVTDLEIMN
jgi:hypothetical protein